MKTPNFLIYFLGFASLFSCADKDTNKILKFHINKTINFVETNISGKIANPFELAILSDDLVVVFDMESDYTFKAFSIDSFQHRGDFVRKGRGPGEEVFVFPSFRRYGHMRMLYQVFGSLKIGEFKVLSKDSLSFFEISNIPIPASMFQDYGFFKIGDSIFSSVTFTNTSRDFAGLCIKSNTPFEWGKNLPLSRPKTLAENDIFFVAKSTTVKPDRNRFATGYQNLPIIRIYSANDGTMLFQKQLDDYSKNKEIIESNDFSVGKGFKTYYHSIKSTDKYIFGLYVNRELKGNDQGLLANDIASIIHVFDWDGNPIMKLELDRPIFSFDVTPDNKQIIAISITDPDNLLVAEIPWD